MIYQPSLPLYAVRQRNRLVPRMDATHPNSTLKLSSYQFILFLLNIVINANILKPISDKTWWDFLRMKPYSVWCVCGAVILVDLIDTKINR